MKIKAPKELLNPGIYTVKIRRAQEGISKAPLNRRIALTLDAIPEGNTFKDYLVNSEGGYAKIRQFHEAIGRELKHDEDLDAKSLEELYAKALVGLRIYQDEEQNFVVKWLPLETAPPETTTEESAI